MQLITIRFLRSEGRARDDDVIRVFDSDCNDLFRVTFHASEMKKPNQFFASRHYVLEYISDILVATTHDTDPFESIQVDTAIHPSIMYHVADMEDYHIRRLMENTIDAALYRTIVKVDSE